MYVVVVLYTFKNCLLRNQISYYGDHLGLALPNIATTDISVTHMTSQDCSHVAGESKILMKPLSYLHNRNFELCNPFCIYTDDVLHVHLLRDSKLLRPIKIGTFCLLTALCACVKY